MIYQNNRNYEKNEVYKNVIINDKRLPTFIPTIPMPKVKPPKKEKLH